MPMVRRSVLLGLGAVTAGMAVREADAQAGVYGFSLISGNPRRQVGALLRVRITDPVGVPVIGAHIIAATLDKSPDGQIGDVARVTPVTDADYGVYGFRTDLGTDGRYALTITLQVHDFTVPVQGVVQFEVARPRPPGAQSRPRAR